MTDEFKSMPEIEMEEAKKRKEESRKTGSKAELIELVKNTLIMLAIAVVAGGILGFVYEITKEPIAIMEAKKKQEANQKVFLFAKSFSEDILDDELINGCKALQFEGVEITEVLEAYDDEKALLGYVCEVVSHEGYGGDIVFRIGIELGGNINAISITEISETAGLGMRAEEVLAPQFNNRQEMEFTVTKTGASADDQIDAISSATITSKAVTKGVNLATAFYRECLMGGANNES